MEAVVALSSSYNAMALQCAYWIWHHLYIHTLTNRYLL